MSIRLNKLLAQRGVGARRKCDLLIKEGKVRVNGRVELEPGVQVEPERDRVTVDGRPLAGAATLRYYVLNKPVGVITTLDDPEGRRTIREFLPPGPRLFPVGRLDADTSGLLILTNDGELAHRLMHPRYGVVKTYRARLERVPGPEALRRLQEGVEFEPGVRSGPARVRVLSDEEGDAMIQVAAARGPLPPGAAHVRGGGVPGALAAPLGLRAAAAGAGAARCLARAVGRGGAPAPCGLGAPAPAQPAGLRQPALDG